MTRRDFCRASTHVALRKPFGVGFYVCMGPDQKRLLKYEDVAERLAVSKKTVQRLTASGQLRAVRVGASIRFEEADIDAYLASHGTTEVDRRLRATRIAARTASPVVSRSGYRPGSMVR